MVAFILLLQSLLYQHLWDALTLSKKQKYYVLWTVSAPITYHLLLLTIGGIKNELGIIDL